MLHSVTPGIMHRKTKVLRCNASDHARIREHFRSRGMTRIAGNLDRLRQWRNACDYDDSIEISERSYDAMMAQAKYVFEALRDE